MCVRVCVCVRVCARHLKSIHVTWNLNKQVLLLFNVYVILAIDIIDGCGISNEAHWEFLTK